MIEARDPTAAEENAALIAEHLEAAGDLHDAYGWHMRSATWATNRDIRAARLGWERALQIAGALPADDPASSAMRIAPRTMLCGTAWRVREQVADGDFNELRQLCAAIRDRASLAISIAGLVMDRLFQDRVPEASRLASEAWELSVSIGDSALTVGLSFPLIYAAAEDGVWRDVMRWSDQVIHLADGDPAKGNFIFGSPLALALTTRGLAQFFMGGSGWRDDLRQGLTIARNADPMAYATAVTWVSNPGVTFGALYPDDQLIGEIEDAVRIAERSGDDLAVTFARATLGIALVHRQTEAERDVGQQLLAEAKDSFVRRRHNLCDLPLINLLLAGEARREDRDHALQIMRAAVAHLFSEGRLRVWGPGATGVLVETLLDGGTEADIAEAEAVVGRLAATTNDGTVQLSDIWLLKLRTLICRARGERDAYRDLLRRYTEAAHSHGYEGHIQWAKELAASTEDQA